MTREKAKELLPIIQAIADGKDFTLQTPNGNGGWVDCNGVLDSELFYYTYRIKPEEELYTIEQNCGEKHYRPFKDCSELIMITGTKLLWVTNIVDGCECLITGFGTSEEYNEDYVIIRDMQVNMKELYCNWRFADGSLCGLEK